MAKWDAEAVAEAVAEAEQVAVLEMEKVVEEEEEEEEVEAAATVAVVAKEMQATVAPPPQAAAAAANPRRPSTDADEHAACSSGAANARAKFAAMAGAPNKRAPPLRTAGS